MGEGRLNVTIVPLQVLHCHTYLHTHTHAHLHITGALQQVVKRAHPVPPGFFFLIAVRWRWAFPFERCPCVEMIRADLDWNATKDSKLGAQRGVVEGSSFIFTS